MTQKPFFRMFDVVWELDKVFFDVFCRILGSVIPNSWSKIIIGQMAPMTFLGFLGGWLPGSPFGPARRPSGAFRRRAGRIYMIMLWSGEGVQCPIRQFGSIVFAPLNSSRFDNFLIFWSLSCFFMVVWFSNVSTFRIHMFFRFQTIVHTHTHCGEP